MKTKYSIDQTTKTLVFTGKQKSLNKDSVEKKDKERFTSVVIPNSVEVIEKWAFEDCQSVLSIHIPNSIVTIKNSAFLNCSSLASVHIPNSVTSIGLSAFRNCKKLASIHIPNSVSAIGWWAFDDCSRLHKACIHPNSIINSSIVSAFSTKTAILRPLLQPITSLQKKSACRASKATYSIYL